MRVTRAAIRAQAQEDEMPIHEDSDAPQDQQPKQMEQVERPALKDITDENSSSTMDEHTDLKNLQPQTKKAKGRKKGKGVKKDQGKDDGSHDIDANTTQTNMLQIEAIDGEHSLSQQSDLDEFAQLEHPPAATPVTAVTETPPDHRLFELATTTMHTPQKELVAATKTPKFDPATHIPTHSPTDLCEIKDDSFIESIKNRSPSKRNRESEEPDSFVDDIITRTPARQVSRIEDSVEAMDALEEAIEEFSNNLSTLDQIEVELPVKVHKQSPVRPGPSSVRKQSPEKATPVRRQNTIKAATPAVRKAALDTTISTKTPKTAKVSPAKANTALLKSVPSRTMSGRVSTVKPTAKAPAINKSTTRPTTVAPKVAPRLPPTNDSRPMMSFSGSPTKQQPNVVKKRVTSGPLSTSKPAFVPAKSSKPPTTSTFTLPGEAIAAKHRAQREERARKEEEEKAKPAFKARPVPPKHSRPSLEPRENKASQARTSAVRSGSNKENVVPRPIPSTVGKPGTNVTVNKTRTDPNKANSAVRRTTVPPKPRASLAPHVASQAAGEKLAVTKEDVAQQKIKGKEVFGRARTEKAAAEKEKREKEEAAKRARAEAAERGRQASRDWAEKQKRKLEAQKAAKAALDKSPTAVAVVVS